MSDYGLTSQGPNIKRLDVILDDMHTNLSKEWGVNTKQNPESLLNHLLTNVADSIAELWEFGAEVYYSQYPSSAEGISLDYAAQYGGSQRETAAKSYYPIHCTGKDGTTLAAGTLISSTTNPTTQLSITESKSITRSACNSAVLKLAALEGEATYTVAINATVYSCGSGAEDSTVDVLNGLAAAITEDGFTATVDSENETLTLAADDETSTNEFVLSENLTTETVTSIITFGTVDTGDILLPTGVITNIVKADAGLLSVTNKCVYIAGQEEETDIEFRQSYADKIFNRSSRMLESIRSAILNNVQGVISVAPYENPSHEWDEYGRPPHSIEIVVDGGSSDEIAKQILEEKAGGINTYGDVSVIVPGEYGEDITIRFSRPKKVYVWFHLGITLKKNESIPPNYAELLREVVLEHIDELNAGEDVIPQEFLSEFYTACSGISYIDLSIFATENAGEEPAEYPDHTTSITQRQRAYTTEDMIEVVIDG